MIVRRESGVPLAGRLAYAGAEYAFRFDVASAADLLDRAGGSGLAAVSIGTLQIEVGVATRRALFVWGMHPKARWIEAALPQPSWEGCAVVIGPEVEYAPGTSVPIADFGEWNTVYDPTTGWVRVSADSGPEDELSEVASGVLIGVVKDHLASVWLMPVFE
ncbi:hypothetical protein Vau01_110360 [Virgisporangium aurantiacum]|uniref:Uncharacterized protein n=1 Tax=Virgisporangium aurantiacum TaxID=175570 RepID=A0A8J4E5Y9_9ACTN|nr:hypothetical protein Vau01_110360 [Virgisporangium aurantiacum]